MTPVDKIVAFTVFVLLALLIGYALRDNARARLGGRGEV